MSGLHILGPCQTLGLHPNSTDNILFFRTKQKTGCSFCYAKNIFVNGKIITERHNQRKRDYSLQGLQDEHVHHRTEETLVIFRAGLSYLLLSGAGNT